MKKILVAAILIMSGEAGKAQETFHNAVKVEFEKVVYVRQQQKELNPEWFEQFKKK